MLCVKPKDITGVLQECSNKINKNHLILSIAAGIPIKQIENVCLLIYIIIVFCSFIHKLVNFIILVFTK